MSVPKLAKIAMKPITTSLSNQYMAKRQCRGILLTQRDVNHAMAPVRSTLKKAEEEG
jgi:hypothetical protein